MQVGKKSEELAEITKKKNKKKKNKRECQEKRYTHDTRAATPYWNYSKTKNEDVGSKITKKKRKKNEERRWETLLLDTIIVRPLLSLL